MEPEMPASIRADEIVGRWGLASFQNPNDRARTGEQDREIVSFDGRVLVTRFIDKDAATRYGNMVYVRCGARA